MTYTVVIEDGYIKVRHPKHGTVKRLSHAEIVSDDLGGFYHPLVAAGWNIAQMGQRDTLGCVYATPCVYATREQVEAFLRSKNFPLQPEGLQ